ncbi:MAG: redoxin domain-containing protein [Clostridia bacterium]|nr:redoxin domain-containing protein [Clostridia bacterium]
MKRIKSLLALVLALVMMGSCIAFAEEATGYTLGGPIDDFTVTTWDGQTVTLSQVLAEKEMVLINIWATWCGPCRNEFPFMEEAYKQYSDKVEVIALSCEPTDTDDVLAEFVQSMGMTFKVAQDTVGMADKLYVSAIPTTIVVDRFGNICFWEEGSLPDVGSFTRLFDAFVGEDYTESTVLYAIPPMKPNVAPAAEADLAAALEVDAAANVADEYTWPMAIVEKDGRTAIASTNATYGSTTASVSTTVTAAAGNAIVVTFKTSTEAGCDLLNIAVNGETVKIFGGEHDWMTWAIPVEADGEYTVTLSYVKDMMADGGEDAIWVDSVAVATGDAAAAALAANPVYPVAEANTLTVTSPNAREIVISDEAGILMNAFGPATYYIINDDVATFEATITADVDPEGAFFYSYYDGATTPLSAAMTETGYAVATGVDSLETTGYTYCYMAMYLDPTGSNMVMVIFLKDEANVNAFVTNNGLGTWQYADGTQPGSAETPVDIATPAGLSEYVIRYADQDGNPVAGVMVQVCDAETCQVYTTDENGVVTFTAPAYAWEIHTLKLPEGYEGDTQTVTLAPVEGGEMVFTVTKN